jgi:hypothetical protein
MKAYVLTTGSVFGLLTVTHLWRMAVERQLLRDPYYLSITLTAAALCVWAGLVVRRAARA